MVAGMGRLGWLAAVLLLTAVGRCHDVVFSAARLKAMKGGFQAIESAHLYRIHEDGSGLKPLTAGGDSDTNPCLTSDGRRILFWRSGPERPGGEYPALLDRAQWRRFQRY